jgi:hypothetical protein
VNRFSETRAPGPKAGSSLSLRALRAALCFLLSVFCLPPSVFCQTDGPATLPQACTSGTLSYPCQAPAFPNTPGYVTKTVCASGCSYTTPQAAVNAIHSDGGDTNGEVIANSILSYGTFGANPSGFDWINGPPSYTGCTAIFANSYDANFGGNVYIGVPSGSQANYTGPCTLPAPVEPLVTTSKTGGSIPDATVVYVRITYVDSSGHETAPSVEQPQLSYWQPGHSYSSTANGQSNTAGYIWDSNNNLEAVIAADRRL